MKILFIDTIHPYLEKKLSEAGMTCDMVFETSAADIDEIIHLYEGIVLRSRIKMDAQRLEKASNLKFIARAGSGMENIDVKYCQSNNIDCYNAPEANCKAVGEHAIGMLLTLFNKHIGGNKEMREGLWRREENRGLEIGHRSIGIIGFGHNGKAFANLSKAFGAKVLAYDKYVEVDMPGIQLANLSEIYKTCDVISFHVPLTHETHYYFNAEFVNKMKKPFYLINTSRGPVVSTKDLVAGMRAKKVLGACLDVLEYEKSDFELMNLNSRSNADMEFLLQSSSVVLSPHVAGWTQESLVKLSEVLAEKILSKYG
ncbi:MAG: D-3-phosphoglycerate dehydrogenase [Patiriisocius sp.]|jgi:D-3-phosphoglycerate dehydrogenase